MRSRTFKGAMDTMNRRAAEAAVRGARRGGFALTDAEAQQRTIRRRRRRTARRRRDGVQRRSSSPRTSTQTVRVLSDLIIPADERSGSATDAGVPEFMDFIMVIDQPARQVAMRGGLAWLDLECQRRFDKTFVGAPRPAPRCSTTSRHLRRARSRASTHGRRSSAASAISPPAASGQKTTGNTVVPKWEGCPNELKKLGLLP